MKMIYTSRRSFNRDRHNYHNCHNPSHYNHHHNDYHDNHYHDNYHRTDKSER